MTVQLARWTDPIEVVASHGIARAVAEYARCRALRLKADASCAHDLMTSPAITVPDTATVAEAARLMDRFDVSTLPVLDETGRLVGMMSRRDVLRLFVRTDADLRAEGEERRGHRAAGGLSAGAAVAGR